MRIIRSIDALPRSKKICITIGNFDGLHRGHKKIIRSLNAMRKKMNALSVVMTFEKHPRRVMGSDQVPLLFSLEHKMSALETAGVDVCLLLPFNKRLRRLSKYAFMQKYMPHDRVSHVVIGYDFRFGADRNGSHDDIAQYCLAHGIGFTHVQPVQYKNAPISSKRIRDLVSKGLLADVQNCVGEKYAVIGVVERGMKIGRKIDIPTANVHIFNEVLPPEGVYEVSVKLLKKKQRKVSCVFEITSDELRGLAYRGPNPKFLTQKKPDKNMVEVFVRDFTGNLYNRYVEITFGVFRRKPRKVTSLSGLKELLENDIRKKHKKLSPKKK